MLKHSGSQKLIPPFFHKMPTLQKLIPQNTSFFMPQSQKYYAEWNNHFCAAHEGDCFTSKQVYLAAHDV